MATTIDEATRKGARSEVEHLDGCPADRIERYDQVRPSDGQTLTTTRCIDCGAQRVDTGRVTRRKESTDG